MARLQWRKYRIIVLAMSVLLVYFIFRARTYEHKAFVLLPKVHPNVAWEFVADFSNMRHLNPTIINFSILEERGNYDHWIYSTEYLEKLSHWPYFHNHAIAHFDVKASPKKDEFYINSVHKTCFFMGYYCLNSESQFKFLHSNVSTKDAFCEETIKYECPLILSSFCTREVVYQRSAIMNNLAQKLTGRSTSI